MEDISTWPSKAEVLERTGLSERTLERKIRAGEIRKAYRHIPGRKPLTLIHPEDAKQLEVRTLKPVPVEKSVQPGQSRHPARDDLLTALLTPRLLPKDKVYLNLKEGAAFLGLPMTYLRKKIQEQAIPAVKIAGWRMKRADLERYDAMTGRLSE